MKILPILAIVFLLGCVSPGQISTLPGSVNLVGYATATWEDTNVNYFAVYYDLFETVHDVNVIDGNVVLTDRNATVRHSAGICLDGMDWNVFNARAVQLRTIFYDGQEVYFVTRPATLCGPYWVHNVFETEIISIRGVPWADDNGVLLTSALSVDSTG